MGLFNVNAKTEIVGMCVGNIRPHPPHVGTNLNARTGLLSRTPNSAQGPSRSNPSSQTAAALLPLAAVQTPMFDTTILYADEESADI